MKTRSFRILGAVLAALLPACGGGGGASGGGTANTAFPIIMKKPSAGQTFTSPATISLTAAAADDSVAKVDFVEGVSSAQGPNTWGGGTVVATVTQPPFQATWADVPAGVHTLVAIATDSLGAASFSNTVTISVLAPGETSSGWMPFARVWASPRAMSFIDANRGWIADINGAILHTTDGGATWVVQMGGPLGCTQCLSLLDIQFVDTQRGWAAGDDFSRGGIVFRTTDGGATWTSSSVGPQLSALSFVDADTGWTVGGNGVFATKDGGVTWTLLPMEVPSSDSFQGVHFADRQSGWILGTDDFRGVIWHTTDGGLTWTEQLRADLSVYFRAMDFVSTSTGWVSRVGFLPEHNRILFTNDGGSTWTEQSFPGSDAISALDFVSPTQGWGAGISSIIHTEDGGASWVTQQSSGAPFGPFFVDVRFINVNVGWAVRQDGLLLKTTTGGKSP